VHGRTGCTVNCASLLAEGQRFGFELATVLAHIIHERFYCNRRYAAATSLAVVVSRPGEQARLS